MVAVPYATGFDHLRVADEAHARFERCLKALGPAAIRLPRYGVGHSLGALLHALVGSRYPVPSSGNVLMSYNNRPATGEGPRLGRAAWEREAGEATAGRGSAGSAPPSSRSTPGPPLLPSLLPPSAAPARRLHPAAVPLHRPQPAGAGAHPVAAVHLPAAVGRGAVD